MPRESTTRKGRSRFVLLTAHCTLLTLLFLYTSIAHAAPGAWRKQSTGTLAWLHSVFFLDQNRGWAAGSSGVLLSTFDGGRTWTAKSRPTEDTVRDIYFANEENGWLVCERNIYELKAKDEPRAYLLATSDGGAHWKRTLMRGIDPEARLTRALFNADGRGWAFGEGGAIYMTRDAGANWIRMQLPTRRLLFGGAFIDDTRGWLVGSGATILHTSDGGDTWRLSILTDAANVRFNATSFVNERLGWAVGTGGSIYRTIDGGRTWRAQNSRATADLFDVKFLDEVEGWVAGADGNLLHTNDGGNHWTTESTGVTHPLERLFFADRTHGWAVGFGGTVVAYMRAEAPALRR